MALEGEGERDRESCLYLFCAVCCSDNAITLIFMVDVASFDSLLVIPYPQCCRVSGENDDKELDLRGTQLSDKPRSF